MLKDIRYAARVLLRDQAWTLMVVLSLALGIGANTALFSAVNGLLLKTVPVDDPDTLVRLRHVGRNQMSQNSSEYGVVASEGGVRTASTFPYPIFQELRRANQTLIDLAAGAPSNQVNVVVDGQAEIATSYIASGNFYPLLGVRAAIGRTLGPEDDDPAAPPVAVVGHGFWTRRLGRSPAAVGRVIQVNNVPVTIVGVLPPDFTGIQRPMGTAPDVGLPLSLDGRINATAGATGRQPRTADPTFYWLQLVGRLKPGVSAPQVEGNLAGVFETAARAGYASVLASLTPEQRASSQYQNRTEVSRLQVSLAAHGLYDNRPEDLRTVTILGIVVALILLLVCANVANLQLARAAARRRELSVRLSLGATRGRLIRQLLTESVVLALAGAACGLLVAYWGRQLLPAFGVGPGATSASGTPLDWRVLGFTATVGVLCGVLFGIGPALRATRMRIGEALKETNRTVAGARSLAAKSLLVGQVAIGLVLVIGAGLFLRTVGNLRAVDVGFDPDNLVLFRVSPQLNGYDQERIAALYDRMTERLQAVPGVRAVTLSNPPLLTGNVNTTSMVLPGRPYVRGEGETIYRMRVAANFFETMGIPLVAGRPFTAADHLTSPKVAIVNEAAVRKFFPGENPLGRRFGHAPETSAEIEIVGVVRDVRYAQVREEAPATMYVPYKQGPGGTMAVEVRTAVDPSSAVPAIREAVRQVDPDVPLMNVSTQVEQIEGRFEQERLLARAYLLFGALSLLVAAVGLFGVMSYSVTRRTSEIGVRMALGARPLDVVGLVMRESMGLVGAGIVLGVAGALAAGQLIATILFGVRPGDPSTIAAAVLVMAAVSALAGYLPARRAARVDPMVSLRCE